MLYTITDTTTSTAHKIEADDDVEAIILYALQQNPEVDCAYLDTLDLEELQQHLHVTVTTPTNLTYVLAIYDSDGILHRAVYDTKEALIAAAQAL